MPWWGSHEVKYFLFCHFLQKQDAAEDASDEAVPVAFRYNIEPARSKMTNVFRPNTLQGEPKSGSLGALWLGKFEQLPCSKMIDVIWEASGKGF